MSETLTQPALGLHRGMPADEYHADDALNNTRLTRFAVSPMYCQWCETHPEDESDSMALGTALHTCLLEPKRFAADFVTAPKCDRRTNVGKAKWDDFCKASVGKTVVEADVVRAAEAMRESVLAHPYARNILASRIETELSGFWTDEETGLRCKFRADAIAKPKGAEFPTLIDIKTTRSIEPDDFAKSMKTFGYFRQLPFYLMGLTELDLHCDSALIIAVESSEPYEVAVIVPDPEDLALGRRHARALMKQYAQCVNTDHWPDRNGGNVVQVAMSEWARLDIKTELKHLED